MALSGGIVRAMQSRGLPAPDAESNQTRRATRRRQNFDAGHFGQHDRRLTRQATDPLVRPGQTDVHREPCGAAGEAQDRGLVKPGDLEPARELWTAYERLPGSPPLRPAGFAPVAESKPADRGKERN